MGYEGKLPTDPEEFTGWSFQAMCEGCGGRMVDVWLMKDGTQEYRPHKYVPRDPVTHEFTGKLADCPDSGKRYR